MNTLIILLEIRFNCSNLVFYCDGNIIKHLMLLALMLFVQRNYYFKRDNTRIIHQSQSTYTYQFPNISMTEKHYCVYLTMKIIQGNMYMKT